MVEQWLANGSNVWPMVWPTICQSFANHWPTIDQPLLDHLQTMANHCVSLHEQSFGVEGLRLKLLGLISVCFFHLTIWSGFGPPNVPGRIVDMDVALKRRLHSVIGFCAKDGAEMANYANSHMPALHGCKTKIAIGGRRKEQ